MADKQKTLSIIDKNVEMEGILNTKGKLLVVGVLKGTLLGDTVVTVEGSSVSARTKVRELIVGGDFEGDVIASERLKILNTGNFSGTIVCNRLSVEAGGRLNGHVEPLDSEAAPALEDADLAAAASMLQAISKEISSEVPAADTALEAAG